MVSNCGYKTQSYIATSFLLINLFCGVVGTSQPPPFPSTLHLNGTPASGLRPSAGMVIECDRAIYILQFGRSRSWQTPAQYLGAFKQFSARGTSGDVLTGEQSAMIAFLEAQFHEPHIWDEKPPIEVEVNLAINALSHTRDAMLETERTREGGGP
jgi:hypothetical protein